MAESEARGREAYEAYCEGLGLTWRLAWERLPLHWQQAWHHVVCTLLTPPQEEPTDG